MTEDYLYFLWENNIAIPNQFHSSDYGTLQILERGTRNTFSGPDFLNARIKIEGSILVGDIEFHVRSSDWYAHQHQDNEAFHTVILHLVYSHDAEVSVLGKILPTISLKRFIKEKHYHLFSQWKNDFGKSIKCQGFLNKNPIILNLNFDELVNARLRSKAQLIVNDYIHYNHDLHQTLFSTIGKVLGNPSNIYPMARIADRVSWKTLQRINREKEILATMLAVSELPPSMFSNDVIQEIEYRSKQLSLEDQNIIWNFSRLRPNGAPSIKVFEWALLTSKGIQNLYQLIINKSLQEIEELLGENTPNKYFQKSHVSGLSQFSRKMLMINALSPFALFLSKVLKKPSLSEFANEILVNQPFEVNLKTKPFKPFVEKKTAATSQALIHHYNSFCQPKKCLHCSIGKQWLLNYD